MSSYLTYTAVAGCSLDIQTLIISGHERVNESAEKLHKVRKSIIPSCLNINSIEYQCLF